MKNYNRKCLLLNSDYSPISIIDWKKAIIWHIKSKLNNSYGIEIIDFYDNDYIICPNQKMKIPSIAKIKKYVKSCPESVIFSRKNVFLRDDYTCQYCGQKKIISELTYDHVIPKSKWIRNKSDSNPTSWTNIATACKQCNRRKRNRTPEEAKMPLINLPYKPNKSKKYLPIHWHLSKIDMTIPDQWKIYLTGR
jgi:5-methylcytosine-specific restriction endonuclease McrA